MRRIKNIIQSHFVFKNRQMLINSTALAEWNDRWGAGLGRKDLGTSGFYCVVDTLWCCLIFFDLILALFFQNIKTI